MNRPFLVSSAILSMTLLPPVMVKADVHFKPTAQFDSPQARQGVAVDREFVYVIDNRAIAKHRKSTGERILLWRDDGGGILIHLNAAVAIDGKLYAAHSNWPGRPFRNSVEIWNAATLTHVASHHLQFGDGALNWLDFFGGFWWAGFAGYDDDAVKSTPANCGKEHTVLVKLDKDWNALKRWTFPSELLERFGAMSNSGGSWGPDGLLYLTGHDRPEVYRMKVPGNASVLKWLGTSPLNIRGQGIAWDRQAGTALYGIVRASNDELRKDIQNRVVAFNASLP